VTLRVLVSGMVAGVAHHGGASWSVLQYVLGLRGLGHDVMLAEPVEPGALECVDRLDYFRAICEEFDLAGRGALIEAGGKRTAGASYEAVRRFAAAADVHLNVAGMLQDEALVSTIPVRAYLDLDPAFTQFWQQVEGIDMRFEGHTHFVTVGLALARGEGEAPTCGRDWLATLPPVAMPHWPVADDLRHDAFTTIANWRGYGSIEHCGVHYGQKAHSIRELLDVAGRAPRPVVAALAIHPDEREDIAALARAGWQLADPAACAGAPNSYRSFVQGSLAELGLAKSGYVRSRCGWFSDRSACYLASGRPVLAQDTGFGADLPTGEGLLAFGTVDEAAAGMDDLVTRYGAHRRAARELAQERFASDIVLGSLLDRLGASA
jgi:hypothetical protein